MPSTNLSFLHAKCMPLCDARVDKFFVGYHTLQFVSRGQVELFYGAERHLLESGSLWTAFPGPRIRFHAAQGCANWHHRYAAFTGPRVAEWIAAGLWFESPQRIVPCQNFVDRFDALIEAINAAPSRFGTLRASNLLESLIIDLAEQRGREAEIAPPAWFEILLNDLGNADFEPMTWADDHGMSLPTLRRHFKKITGSALNESAIQTRLAQARNLLAETDLAIKFVAEELGYKDVYFFTRQFTQASGISPAAFRRSRQ